MSRGVFSSSNYLLNNNSLVGAGDFTVACWVYPTADNAGVCWSAANSGVDDDLWQLWLRASGTLRFRARSNASGTSVNADASGTYSTDTWNLCWCRKTDIGVTDTLQAGVGGSAGGGTAEGWTAIDPTISRTAIGLRCSSTLGLELTTGYVGPVGIWRASLADAVLDAIAGGMDFRWFAPDHYYECHSSSGDEIDTGAQGNRDMAEQGTLPVQAENPTIRRRGIPYPAAVPLF